MKYGGEIGVYKGAKWGFRSGQKGALQSPLVGNTILLCCKINLAWHGMAW